MDLAFPDRVWVPGIRLKLHFEDCSILSSQQVDDGLLNSWFGVRPHLQCIGDLASDIASSFQLSKSCPHGISLRMEKFTLPPPQPVWLLKDNDIVSVKKNDRLPSTMRDVKWIDRLSPDKKGPKGVDVCVFEEFKEKTRDCNSEKGKRAQESPSQILNFVDIPPKTAPTAEPKLKKKRKHTEHEGVDEQEQGRELQVVPYTGEDTRKNVKGLKKKKLSMHKDIKDGVLECEKARNCRKSMNLKFGEETGKEKGFTQVQSKKKKKHERSETLTSTVEKHGGQQCSQQILHFPRSCSLNDGKVMDQEKKLLSEAEAEGKKKPSRSTLRKKAKRRWKREHPEVLEATKGEKLSVSPNDPPCNEIRKTDCVSLGFPACLNNNEDDGEAEEEKLPFVVKPGHIRFVHVDEGEENNHVQISLDKSKWSHVVSKRQGQNWGQEKVQGRRSCEKVKETVLANSEDVGGEIIFDSLPFLKTEPQVDDILAYRVVELTPSMCPELSEYRVGKVDEFEPQSGMLKLISLPNYPPLKRTIEDLAQEMSCDISFPSPYSEDGSLETQLASLIDVRLLRAAMNVKQGPLDSLMQESNVMARTDKHENDPAEAMAQLSDGVDGQYALDLARKGLSNTSETSMVCSPTVNRTPAACHPELIDQGLSNNSASAWQDLSEMLHKKKDELSRLEAVTSTSQQIGSPAFTEGKTQCNYISPAKNLNGKTGFQHKSRFRPRKAGALGPTMALLRAQNEL